MHILPSSHPSEGDERIYFAAPVSAFRYQLYDTRLAETRLIFPAAEIISARDYFRSTKDWRRRWPALLRHLTGLVFIDDGYGCIGIGVRSEVREAQERGIPVWFLAAPDGLYRLDEITFERFSPLDPYRYARVRVSRADKRKKRALLGHA